LSQIPQEIVDQVRFASEILNVVSGYLTLRRKGHNYFGVCPFHKEKTPSFSVNPDLQIFHCFGCGAGGNVFTFIMKMEGITFPEAVKILAQQAGISLPEDAEKYDDIRAKEALYFANALAADYYREMLNSDQAAAARDYLRNRGITETEYDQFSLGYAPNSWNALINFAAGKSVPTDLLFRAGLVVQKENGDFYDRFRGRITFAIKNLTSQVVAFGARRMANDNSPKYINSPETDIYQKRLILYGLHISREHIRHADEVIIVEGYTDLTSLCRIHINNVVATSGTALTEEHARMLRRYTANAILFYDSDSAGAAAALRGADILLENGMEVKICTAPTGKDPDEFARQQGEDGVRRLLTTAIPLIEFKLNRIESPARHSSSSQKAALTREILSSIARMGDPIRRSFLVRDLAERLHIDETGLWSEMGNMQVRSAPTNPVEPNPADTNDYFKSQKGSAELGLFKISLLYPDIIPVILVNVNVEDIEHPEIRSFFTYFKEYPTEVETFNVKDYVSSVRDQILAGQISFWLQENIVQLKHQEFARQCLITFQVEKIEAQQRLIRQEMGVTHSPQVSAELMDRMHKYLLERQKASRGEFIIGLPPPKQMKS